MSEITIKTNKQKRPLINFWELSDEDQKYFDYDEDQTGLYFRYRGNTYDLGDFMRLPQDSDFGSFWNGYTNDTYFSGVLVHLCQDSDFIIVGTYYS